MFKKNFLIDPILMMMMPILICEKMEMLTFCLDLGREEIYNLKNSHRIGKLIYVQI